MAKPDIVGGLIELRANGKYYETEGDVTLRTTNSTKEARATNSGKPVVVVNPRAYGAAFTFTRVIANNILDLWDQCDVDITVTEKPSGRRHYFTRSALVGEPEVNPRTGEINGVEVVAERYEKRDAA